MKHHKTTDGAMAAGLNLPKGSIMETVNRCRGIKPDFNPQAKSNRLTRKPPTFIVNGKDIRDD